MDTVIYPLIILKYLLNDIVKNDESSIFRYVFVSLISHEPNLTLLV